MIKQEGGHSGAESAKVQKCKSAKVRAGPFHNDPARIVINPKKLLQKHHISRFVFLYVFVSVSVIIPIFFQSQITLRTLLRTFIR